ncbi:MAG: glycosyltransferase 87 family protein [Thermoleophilaceae bacterium]
MILRAAILVVLAMSLAAPAYASGIPTIPPKPDGLDVSKPLPQPSPVVPQVFRVNDYAARPPGFRITGSEAVDIAAAQPAIRKLRQRYPQIRALPTISGLGLEAGYFFHWSVQFLVPGNDDKRARGEVELGPDGHIYEVTTGVDVGWPLVHGYSGVLGHELNRPYIWLVLCLLFVLPFIDFRNPFRLLHLDLIALLAFGASQFFFNLGKPWLSVPLVYPVLLYCTVRMIVAGFRPATRRTPLIPHIGNAMLLTLLVVLLAARGAFGVVGAQPIDVGFAGAVGADRVAHGQELYIDNRFHPDTYGPVNYLAYVPFELAFPYHGEPDILPSAKVATVAFDALMVLALFLLGRQLRAGPPGTRLGLALALAWTAYPYTSLVIASTTNDALVPLFVVAALLVLKSPAGRGGMLALGTMVKFVPGLLVPPLAAGRRRIEPKHALIFGTAFAAVCVAVLLPVLPDGGVKEFWNTTLGFQLKRGSPLSIWGRHPDLSWLKTTVAVIVTAFAVAIAWWPRLRTTSQLAALCGAILAASQMGTGYWLYFYLVWFAPFMLIASFNEHRDLGPTASQLTDTSDLVKPERISHPESVTATRSSIRTPSTPGR